MKGHDGGSLPSDTTDRLILPMLDVCVTCLREGVVADEEIVDGAMIFATGFAPFRGGPMHYARARGIATYVKRWPPFFLTAPDSTRSSDEIK